MPRQTFAKLTPLILLLLALPITTARAELIPGTKCTTSPFAGTWKNIDRNDETLIRLDISDVCSKIVGKPASGNNPWSGVLKTERQQVFREYMVRAYSRCVPADCVWARTKGQRDTDGNLKVLFKLFWSQRFIVVTPENGRLRVRWQIKFAGRKKPDQIGESLLERD